MAKRGPKPKKTEFYIDPVEFKKELTEYYKTGRCSDNLGEIIKKIAYGLSYSRNFYDYSYKEDMIGDALVKMWAAIQNKKFDIESESSPFSYFTTIAFHAFINRIKRENKHNETLAIYKEKVYEEEMSNLTDGSYYMKPNISESEE